MSHTTPGGRIISTTDHQQRKSTQNLDEFLGQQSTAAGSTVPDKRTLVKQELRNLCNRKQQGVQQLDQQSSQDLSELPDDITSLCEFETLQIIDFSNCDAMYFSKRNNPTTTADKPRG